ncbi:IS607 family element RNA-guided endonuclease TnpB [Nocardia sp. NPDC051833]|uniref:IS607 family element RNA-guided endonuclease TnpB n=1 Tax=Nocardia sp. NPDC051833 TaxID=3155674 RepID=UPI00343A989C
MTTPAIDARPSMKTLQAYRFALDPTPSQERALWAHAGAARVAHNWALARVKAVVEQRAAERSYGIAESALTPTSSWSLPALRREWNTNKSVVAPWWRTCSKEAFNTGLDALARALKNWSDSRTGSRRGRAMGFPRFKSRRRDTPSVRFTTGAIRLESDRQHVVLPKLGQLKVHESTRKLARRIDAGTARILSATVRRVGGRWYVAFTVEVVRDVSHPRRPNAVVGVDVGITCLAVLSTGEGVPNPRHLDRALRQVRSLSRRLARQSGPAGRPRRQPSRRWLRTKAKLSRLHARVANRRIDGLHKLTTRLADEFGTIVVEDLHVTGMLGNRRVARHIADAGFGEIRRQLQYKTRWNGGRLVVADRWYPSSKTCSSCGVVRTKLLLSDRKFHCDECGAVHDRDLNAARNLAALAARIDTTGSGPEAGRGADQKTHFGGRVAAKRQSGTAAAGKTGTAAPQGVATNAALTFSAER